MDLDIMVLKFVLSFLNLNKYLTIYKNMTIDNIELLIVIFFYIINIYNILYILIQYIIYLKRLIYNIILLIIYIF